MGFGGRTHTSCLLEWDEHMRKILLISILAILSITPAYAQGGHGGGGRGGGGHGGDHGVGRYAAVGSHGGGYYGGYAGGRYFGGGRYYGNYRGNFGWWGLGAAGLWYFTPGSYYTYPYYSYYPYDSPYTDPNMPPVVVAPQTNVSPTPQAAHIWYYCISAKAYYPYVPSCREGWKTVPATLP